jgi:hypothetical protein
MAITLQRVDTVPIEGNKFTFEFQQWVATLVDSLNTTISEIEARLNVVEAPNYTTDEITALAVAAPNGSFWYDSILNQIKAKSNNVVVVIA